MDKIKQIAELIKSIGGFKPFTPIVADVVSVEGESCTVKLSTGLEISDIRLKSSINNGADYFLITPSIGSKVWIMTINNDLSDSLVIKIDQIDKWEIKQNGLIFLIDGTDGKISIKNNATSLLDVFQDLKDLIGQITVSTGVGPSGTPLPPTIASLTAVETKFKNLLK